MFGSREKSLKEYNRLIAEGTQLAKAQRYEEALRLFSEAARIDPKGHLACSNVAFALNKLGRHVEASDVAAQCLALNPESTAGYYQRAVARRALGDLNGAIADYTAYADLKPDNSDVRFHRGMTFKSMGKDAEALADFVFYCHKEPAKARGFLEAGICLRRLERWQEALDWLNRAEEMGPQNHVFYWHRSYTLEGLKRFDEALADVDRAIAMGPQDPEPPRRRLELLEHMGRGEEAASGRARLKAERDRHIAEVAQRGQFVWAALIQANEKLFEEGDSDLNGTVAFTFHQNVRELGPKLAAIARVVSELKFQQLHDPEIAALGNVTVNELGGQERVRVPSRMSGGMEVFCQTVKFYRDFLPSGKLEQAWLPCAADPGPSGEIVHLPWSVGEQHAGMLAIVPAEG